MAELKEMTVPDIGDFVDVPVVRSTWPRRRGRREGPARHAGDRQGDDGRAGAVRRRRRGAAREGRRRSARAPRCWLEVADERPPRPRARRRAPPASEAAAPRAVEGAIAAPGRRAEARAAAPAPARGARTAAPSTPARRCAGWRASWASGWRPSRAPAARAGSPRTCGAAERPRRAARRAPAGAGRPRPAPWPKVDFAKYGEIERVELSRSARSRRPTSRATGPRSRTSPTTTRPTSPTSRRSASSSTREQSDVKVTMVALLLKAVVGRAATPSPTSTPRWTATRWCEAVLPLGLRGRHAQRASSCRSSATSTSKGLLEVAGELTELSGKARAGKLGAERDGGRRRSRSRRSAASAARRSRRSSTRPRSRSSASCARRRSRCGTASEFVPRLMLPLSLSYDHRVIDGAAAARFAAHLSGVLTDLRRVLL